MSGQMWGGITYAQHGEDLIFCMIFDRLGIDRPRYLDIGAYHPTDISNTALLYERGARGVNVEPVPELAAAVALFRPEDVTLCCAVAEERQSARRLYVGENRGLSSFHREVIDCPVIAVIEVPVATVDDIRVEHLGGAWPDLLSVDTEGSDMAILASLPDVGASRPIVVCAEALSQGRDHGEEMRKLMESKGYSLFCRPRANMIFVINTKFGRLFA